MEGVERPYYADLGKAGSGWWIEQPNWDGVSEEGATHQDFVGPHILGEPIEVDVCLGGGHPKETARRARQDICTRAAVPSDAECQETY